MVNGVSQLSTMLYEMERMKAQAQGGMPGVTAPAATPSATPAQGVKPVEFGQVFKQAIDGVNNVQQQAASLQQAFEMGGKVDITQVMIASQKASLSFQAATQVRNKVVDAYKEIMNMPI